MNNLREQQFVRPQPTLGREFQIGQVIDTALPDGRAQVMWQCGPKGCRTSLERLPPAALLPVPLAEGELVMDAINQAARYPPLVQLAVQVASWGWLDLRRDGVWAEAPDLQRMIVDAYVDLKVRTSGKRII